MLIKKTAIIMLCAILAKEAFPPLYGHFQTRRIKFSYFSRVKRENGRWKVVDSINCDSREPLFITWPAAKMNFDIHNQLLGGARKEFKVSYPSAYHAATIFLGLNNGDPVDDVNCYVDEAWYRLQIPNDEELTTTVSTFN